jgi:GntR family phosphonate transport system transcriptional regulator
LADALPVAMFQSTYPADRLPGFSDALAAHSSVTKALEVCGVTDYTRASTRISATAATATQAAALQIAQGAPLVFSTSVNVDDQGVPVEFGKTWFPGDRVTLTFDE